MPNQEVSTEVIRAEGRAELTTASARREVPGVDRGSNGNSRPSGSLSSGHPGGGTGVVPGADSRARLRAEPEAAGEGRELRDMVPQPAVPCPSREETVESRTAVSERVS